MRAAHLRFFELACAVAQLCKLLYRRFRTCGRLGESGRVLAAPGALPVPNRRYSRIQSCATISGRAATPEESEMRPQVSVWVQGFDAV